MQKNRIELGGYLGTKPTARYLPSGTPVANARLAEGYRYRDASGHQQEHTNWHSLVFYGVLADVALTYEKGDNIAVEGTLQVRKFTPSDGGTRTVYEVVVRACHLIAPPRTRVPGEIDDNTPDSQHPLSPAERSAQTVKGDFLDDGWPV
jgi:single-strand DNA-binding protein